MLKAVSLELSAIETKKKKRRKKSTGIAQTFYYLHYSYRQIVLAAMHPVAVHHSNPCRPNIVEPMQMMHLKNSQYHRWVALLC